MNSAELKKQRLQLVHEAVRMKTRPARTPHMSNAFTWMQQFSGKPLSVTLRDYGLLEKTLRDFQETYRFDLLCGTGLRNPFTVTDPMGFSDHVVDDENAGIVVQDHELMLDDEYDLFIENMDKFLWEKVMPRKYKILGEENGLKALSKSAFEFKKYLYYRSKAENFLADEYGVPAPLFNGAIPLAFPGLEFFFNYFRGIVGTSLDLRKHPDKLERACQVAEKRLMQPALDSVHDSPNGSNQALCFDLYGFCLAHTILNGKQFDRFFWPYLKQIIETVVAKDKTVLHWCPAK